jgi:hypothetical protein
MNMDHYRALCAAAFIGMSSTVNAVDADGEAFQCRFPITEGQQSVQLFTLSREVYQCMLRTRHADLSVVNLNGEPVPYRLISQESATDIKRYRRDLPVYPEPAAAPYRTGEQIKRLAQLSGEVSGTEAGAPWVLQNSFYSSLILQQDVNEENKDVLKSITINTAALDVPVNTMLIVEESADLQHWKTLFGPHVLYILPGGQGTLHNNTLDLGAAGGARYLRIAMLSSIENFAAKITGISGEYEHSRQIPVELQWLQAESPEPTDNANEWVASLPGLYPVSRVRFTPAENMVYYKGSLSVWVPPTLSADGQNPQGRKKVKRLAREILKGGENLRSVPDEQGSWRRMTHFMYYRMLTGDGSMNSPDIRMDPGQGRRWKFAFDQKPVVAREQLPRIEFGWQPLQVMFIAQGPGPFSLLAGSEQAVSPVEFPANLIDVDTVPQAVELRSMAPAATGEAALTPKPQWVFNWRTLVLWSILLLGLAGMALMAYRLSRSMNQSS